MSSSYLPYQQFESCARGLAAISDKIGDGWTLRNIKICSEPEKVFLVKTTSHAMLPEETTADPSLLELAGGVEEPLDPAVMLPASNETIQCSRSIHTVAVEYHIVYSESYEVPILYFNATQSDGRQLPVEDIWRLLSTELTSSDTDRWSLVSQQEHPLLSRPFYHIHPCHTAKVMSKAFQSQNAVQSETSGSPPLSNGSTRTCLPNVKEINYLIAWLSMFGPLVGLKVPTAYLSSGTVEE